MKVGFAGTYGKAARLKGGIWRVSHCLANDTAAVVVGGVVPTVSVAEVEAKTRKRALWHDEQPMREELQDWRNNPSHTCVDLRSYQAEELVEFDVRVYLIKLLLSSTLALASLSRSIAAFYGPLNCDGFLRYSASWAILGQDYCDDESCTRVSRMAVGPVLASLPIATASIYRHNVLCRALSRLETAIAGRSVARQNLCRSHSEATPCSEYKDRDGSSSPNSNDGTSWVVFVYRAAVAWL